VPFGSIIRLVCEEMWNLLFLDGGKGRIDCVKGERADRVGTDSAIDSIVVEVCTRVEVDITEPVVAAIGGIRRL